MFQRPDGDPQVVILAAGNGHRLVSREMGIPKPLYPVRGRALLDRVIEPFVDRGLTRFVFVLGFRAAQIEEHFAADRRDGLDVTFVFNPEYDADNGVSVLASSARVDGHFILAMADHVFEPSALDRLLAAGPEPDGVTLAVDRKPDRVFDLAEATKASLAGDRVLVVDKTLQEFDAVDTGLFYAGPALFGALRECGRDGRTRLSDGVNVLAARRRVRAVDVGAARWIDVDTPQALAEIERWIDSAVDVPVG